MKEYDDPQFANETAASDFFNFVQSNLNKDIARLAMSVRGKDLGFDTGLALVQIEARGKTRHKLGGFIANNRFIFPTLLSAEQSTHEAVARYHADLIGRVDKLLDMTAGLGIDAMSASRLCNSVTAVEMDKIKCDALSHNCKVLSIENMEIVNADSVEWLEQSSNQFDTIFIDPARRDSSNGRVYGFTDCLPNVSSCMGLLKERAGRILIKASPLLDISQTLRDIPGVMAIRAVSVEGECKEVLVEVGKETADGILKEAVNIRESGELISSFSFVDNGEKQNVDYATKDDLTRATYLYEPDASMMKLAPWSELQSAYPGILKLSPSSQLFISQTLYKDFPGRSLKIESLPDKAAMKALKGSGLIVVSRNHPLSVAELRKKYSLKEGKDKYLYATRLEKTPVFILCHK